MVHTCKNLVRRLPSAWSSFVVVGRVIQDHPYVNKKSNTAILCGPILYLLVFVIPIYICRICNEKAYGSKAPKGVIRNETESTGKSEWILYHTTWPTYDKYN